MPTLQIKFPYKKNSALVISAEELQELYFYGINLADRNNNKIPSSTIEQFILAAQEETEKWLGIKLQKQIITENKDWYRSDWQNWGYIRTTYPVVEPLSLDGLVGDIRQIQYPKEWLSARKTSDGELYHRHIYLVPSHNTSTTGINSVVYNGVTPHLGFMGNSTIPNYWELSYVTGFCKTPSDLLSFIGMLASIQVFYLMGDLILGTPGISSQSISIDGLSQSVSSQGSYKARIDGYLSLINGNSNQQGLRDRIYNYYKGFSMTVM